MIGRCAASIKAGLLWAGMALAVLPAWAQDAQEPQTPTEIVQEAAPADAASSSGIGSIFNVFKKDKPEDAPVIATTQPPTSEPVAENTVEHQAEPSQVVDAPQYSSQEPEKTAEAIPPRSDKALKSSKTEKNTKTSDKASKSEKSQSDDEPLADERQTPLTFEQMAKKWDGELSKIEVLFKDGGRVATAMLSDQRELVRRIRSQAQEENRVAQEVLDSKTAMLATLGEVPSSDVAGPVIPEDKKIISLRKQMNDDIASADARVKRTALILNRAQKVLDDFTAMEQAEIRMMLMTRSEPVYSSDLWTRAATEWAEFQSPAVERTLAKWYVFGALFFSVLLTFFYTPLISWLNAWNQEVQLQTSRAPFFIAFFSCLLALGLRYDIYLLGMYVNLHTLLHTILVLMIGFAFWRMLAAVRFEDATESTAG